jgi:hypothetical protein
MARGPARRSLVAGAALLAAATVGCVHHHHGEHHGRAPAPAPVYAEEKGPPPWAPAHGYRRKHGDHHHHDGVEIRFNSDIGLYVVVGFPGHYFDGSHYFRVSDRGWELSVDLHRGWRYADRHQVPPGLRKSKRGKKHKHGPPAKHGY